MKIIIIGAGRIGSNLATSLAGENNEVYLIEQNEAIGQKLSDKLDVKVITGNGADPETLEKANVSQADLVLAVTTSDETNLVVCSLAASFGAKRRIARVRNIALSQRLGHVEYHQFGIDEIINPELVAAQAIVKIIETPGASEVSDFADGKILLCAFEISEGSHLSGQRLEDLRDEDFPWPFVIVSIIRGEEVFIPKGDALLKPLDHIYVLLPAPSLGEFLSFIDPEIKLPRKVVIYGATITGKHVAQALSEKIKDLTLIEEDKKRARDVAGELGGVRVINGSASEADILKECGVEAADAFVATSNDDHSNLISSVLAKKQGAKSTIITTQHPDYMSITEALDIDAIINPHHLAVKQILHLVRGKGITSVTKLMEGDAEALEFIPEEGSPVTRDIIRNIKFPKNSIVGAVYRDEEVLLVNGNTQIREGEKVIVFCQETAVKKLQALFTR